LSPIETISDAVRYFDLHAETPEQRRVKTIEFYEQVYRAAFPKTDQAETPDIWLPLMEDDRPEGSPGVGLIIAYNGEQIVGGALLERYYIADCWLLSYIAVRPEARRQGIAAGLMTEVNRSLASYEQTGALLLAETEDPAQCLTDHDQIIAETRLRALDALGLRQVMFDYVQPALAPDKQPLHNLLLLCYDPRQTSPGISAKQLAAFLIDFYTARGQQNSAYLDDAVSILSQQDIITVESLTRAPESLDRLIHFASSNTVELVVGNCIDVLQTLPADHFQTCVTSPPYFNLRSYLPDVVRLRDDLPEDIRAAVLIELALLHITPIDHAPS
jgi:GNAT superfamily N-acetyltransferase